MSAPSMIGLVTADLLDDLLTTTQARWVGRSRGRVEGTARPAIGRLVANPAGLDVLGAWEVNHGAKRSACYEQATTKKKSGETVEKSKTPGKVYMPEGVVAGNRQPSRHPEKFSRGEHNRKARWYCCCCKTLFHLENGQAGRARRVYNNKHAHVGRASEAANTRTLFFPKMGFLSRSLCKS